MLCNFVEQERSFQRRAIRWSSRQQMHGGSDFKKSVPSVEIFETSLDQPGERRKAGLDSIFSGILVIVHGSAEDMQSDQRTSIGLDSNHFVGQAANMETYVSLASQQAGRFVGNSNDRLACLHIRKYPRNFDRFTRARHDNNHCIPVCVMQIVEQFTSLNQNRIDAARAEKVLQWNGSEHGCADASNQHSIPGSNQRRCLKDGRGSLLMLLLQHTS